MYWTTTVSSCSNANDTELLKGHNVYTVLSQMSYLHGSSFAEAKEQLARTGSCYSNAVLDGTELFLRPEADEKNAQWTLAFLVPAEYVAVNTQKLVNIAMGIIIGFAWCFRSQQFPLAGSSCGKNSGESCGSKKKQTSVWNNITSS